jgi:hypothetical protein
MVMPPASAYAFTRAFRERSVAQPQDTGLDHTREASLGHRPSCTLFETTPGAWEMYRAIPRSGSQLHSTLRGIQDDQ